MRLDRFQKWALATTLATYFLIGVGGLVRASGAGLGCPDWPRCFDRWIPPTDVHQLPAHIDPALFNVAKAWTEYVNRLIGVAVGLLIFGALVLAWRHHRRSPRVFYPTLASFLLVGFEGWLGGQVVAHKLAPWMVSVHLAFALIIVTLLLYATVCAFFDGGAPRTDLPAWRVRLGWGAFSVSALVLLQVALGAWVRGEISGIKDTVERSAWLTQLGWTYNLHANFALVVTALVGVLAYATWLRSNRPLRIASAVAVGFVLLQAASGLGMKLLDVPAALQVAHLWLGSLLMGSVVAVALLAFRLPPSEEREALFAPGLEAAPRGR